MHEGFAGLLIPVMAILAWVAITWIRARHGYPLEGHHGRRHRRAGLDEDRKIELLSSENEKLSSQVLRLEERIAVLERIATDPATRVAREIEQLR
jgi:hypothetical protein